jgi:hypothetical protein
MHQLLAALDRLGYVNDCLQLAKLNEEKKTGTFRAHRQALMVRHYERDFDCHAEIIKSEIGTFLKESLELNLSPTKTKITNLKIDSAKFLGFSAAAVVDVSLL